MVALNPLLDRTSSEGASNIATIQYSSILPTSAFWCFDAALEGDYAISKHILRLVLEQVTKLAYFVENPESALRTIIEDKGRDRVDFSEALGALNLEHGKGLDRLYRELSGTYSHANLVLPTEMVYEEDGKIFISGGSRYLPEEFIAIVHQLLILVGNAMNYYLIHFPGLLNNTEWSKNFEGFIQNVENEIEDSFDNGAG